MDLAEAAEQLYAAAPEDFMTRRTELVAAAKAAGDKALAKEIGALRKPTRSAWLVNLLARAAAADLTGLLDIGVALREAQQNLDGAELRLLSAQRHKVVNGLSRRAAALGAEADYTATEAVRQEVAQTLQAALADPEHAELVRRGVLSQAVSYGGFGTIDLGPPPATAPAKTPAKTPVKGAAKGARAGSATAGTATDEDEDPDEAARAEEQRAEELRAQELREAARATWEEARQALEAAEADAERATADADALADHLDELRQQLTDTERAEAEARRSAREARLRVHELAEAERAAREAAAD